MECPLAASVSHPTSATLTEAAAGPSASSAATAPHTLPVSPVTVATHAPVSAVSTHSAASSTTWQSARASPASQATPSAPVAKRLSLVSYNVIKKNTNTFTNKRKNKLIVLYSSKLYYNSATQANQVTENFQSQSIIFYII